MSEDFLDTALSNWAKIRPGAVAVRFGGTSYSYAALDQAASAVAGYLAASGIGAGARVGLYVSKSFDAVAAVFGILRSGAAFVPMDIAAPDARIKTLMASCDLAAVLADDPAAPTLAGVENVAPLAQAVTFDGQPAPVLQRSADALAYILYTSGTTGQPKGICHTHASGNAYAKMAAHLCDLSPQDRVSHQTPLHFDMSIFDLFATIHAGAVIIVIPDIYTKMPASLSKLVQDEGVTVWYSVPFAIGQLVSRGALDARDLSALRVMMFAGEVMPPKTLHAIAPYVPNAVFLNAYGPTETNHCITARIDQAALDGVSPLPIGTPSGDAVAQISDTGELLIASDQVMQGYWKDEQRSRDAFVTMEYNGKPRTFYRTGDVVTQNNMQEFCLTGRVDRQVKLRGYRVELDEVELVLSRCDGVEEVAVVVHDDSLHAFVSGNFEKEELNKRASADLAPYAVPTGFSHLPALLRTSTGKIDRHALAGLANDH